MLQFLQFFILGAWILTIGAYWFQTKEWSGTEFGAIFSTIGLASLFMPALAGIMADAIMYDGSSLYVYADGFYDRNPLQLATLSDAADHIDHVRDLVGIDHVGIGSDFDGVGPTLPVELADASMYPNLVAELLRRDYAEEDIRKLLGANTMRVWREVERRAEE